MTKAKVPPGPINFNAAIGLTWRHYWQLRTDPIEFAQRLTRRYGDLTYFRVFGKHILLVNHPDLIRQVLVSEADNYPKCERIRNQLRRGLGDGLLTSEGDVWRQQRLSVQKMFQSRRMDVFAQPTLDHSLAMTERWRERSTIQIEHEMTLLTQAAMSKALFGRKLENGDQFVKAARTYSDIFHGDSSALFTVPDWFPSPRNRRKQASLQLLRSTITRVVRERMNSGERRGDFLDMLLHSAHQRGVKRVADESSVQVESESSVSDITGRLLTIYLAGFHTTSVALAWLFFVVARDTVVQEKLRDEIRQVCGTAVPSVASLGKFRYADTVIKESLRLYPAAWELFARQSLRETQLGGYRIPTGSLMLIMPIVTQRDPRFFPDPQRFDPQRFDPTRAHEIPEFAYLPFGAGGHACIGKSLALLQMCQILILVLQRFKLSVSEDDAAKVRIVPRVSARPRNDIAIRLRPIAYEDMASNVARRA